MSLVDNYWRVTEDLLRFRAEAPEGFEVVVNGIPRGSSAVIVAGDTIGIKARGPSAAALEPCAHLADSDEPSPGLEDEPCPQCGRYYVDD